MPSLNGYTAPLRPSHHPFTVRQRMSIPMACAPARPNSSSILRDAGADVAGRRQALASGMTLATVLVALSLGPVGVEADAQQDLQRVAALAHTSESLSTALSGAAGLIPALAISPSTFFMLLSGAGLVCGQVDSLSASAVCQHPALRDAGAATSSWVFAVIASFALLSFLTNTGKIQGVLGKGIKVLEAVPALGAAAIVATRVATHADRAIAQEASFMVFIVVGAAVASMAAIIVARLAIEILVWLSPIPFIDLALEVAQRVLAVGLIGLWIIHPALAAFVCVLFVVAAAVCVRWALRMLQFFFYIGEGLLVRIMRRKAPELVDRRTSRRDAGNRELTMALPVAVMQLSGAKRRSIGMLLRSIDGVSIEYHRRGRTLRRQLQPIEVRTRRWPWWCEFQFKDALTGQAVRLLCSGDRAALHDDICYALGSLPPILQTPEQRPQPLPRPV